MKIATDLDVRGALTVAGLPIAAGTVILSGTATPTAGIGNLGDYYLDANDQILYGPKAVSTDTYGAQQTAYTSQTDDTMTTYSAGTSVGADIVCAAQGRILGMRYYRRPGYSASSFTMRVWDSAGVLIATAATSGDSGTGWKTALLATPIVVEAGTYRVAKQYVADDLIAYFGPVAISNGDLTITTSYKDDTAGAGRPTVTGPVNRQYMVDFIFEKFISSGTAWPVALGSATAAPIEVYVQAEPPGAGTVPLLWMDVDDLSMDPEGGGAAARGAPPVVQIYVSPEEPTDPEEGSLWVDTS